MNDELIKSAEQFLLEGTKAVENKDFIQAINCFDKGLETIGSGYDSDGLEDSTGRKLSVAKTFQKQNRLEEAANLKQKILTARLEISKQKYGYE